MPADQHRALNYFSKFACLVDKCPDTCCTGWTIRVEEDRYRKFSAYLREEGKNPDDYLQRLGANNEGSYAKMRLAEEGTCMFLEKVGACSLHAKLGEKVLADACQMYPRKYLIVGNRIEASANLSCPEVVRLALFSEDSVLPVSYRPSLTDKQRSSIVAKGKSVEAQHFDRVRDFGLELLLSPRMTGPKIFILGYFAHKLAERANGRLAIPASELDSLIAHFRDPEIQDGLEEQFDIMYGDEDSRPIGVSIVQAFIAASMQFSPTRRVTLNAQRVWSNYGVINEDFVVSEGTQVKPFQVDMDYLKLWKTYKERRARIETKYVAEFDLYCRNLAVHNWLTHAFSDYPSLIEYLERSMLLECAIVKFAVTGYLNEVKGELTLEAIQQAMVEATVNFYRLVGHSARRRELLDSVMPDYEGAQGIVRLTPLLMM